MPEIPFKIGSSLKWISGISNETTCKDILISLINTEKLLDCTEDTVHLHYALVESWREVSKVLSANSLILKIWTAWGEEQQNVEFTVKRIKNKQRKYQEKLHENHNIDVQEKRSKVQKRLKRRNSRNSVDTFHPNALVKNRQSACNDIQLQMKKIISQGEVIRKHLDKLKNVEEEEATQTKEEIPYQPSTDKLFSSHKEISESVSEEKDIKYMVMDVNKNMNIEFEGINVNSEVCNLIQKSKVSSGDDERVMDEEEPMLFTDLCEDTASGIQLLEQVHRVNRLLETKEEQLLALSLDIKLHSRCHLQPNMNQSILESQAASCFDDEVKMFKELNVKLLKEIKDNSLLIENLQENSDERKKLISQLEFDVNVIERESKRLKTDLLKITQIGKDLHEETIVRTEVTQLQNQLRSSCNTSSCGLFQRGITICKKNDNHSVTASRTNTFVLSEKLVGYQSLTIGDHDSKLEYHSDESSDTGFSSLSSSEGDYSLSTLV